ncbi:MAG: L,D-transpeptidase family protein [Roseibacillus sp.]
MKTLLLILLSALPTLAFELPKDSTQAIVGIASGWDSSHVTLHRYEKDAQGAWHLVSQPWKGRLGSSGIAWGRGLHPVPTGAKMKKEGDRRAPAGVYTLGGAWAYNAAIPHHPNLPFSKITTRDLWVEDVTSKYYNQHVRLDHEPSAAWEKKAQMRQNDQAHSIKLFINHNAPKVVPGGGSSIFFHIWRGGGSKATFGCTTMHENELKALIKWVDPKRNPVYILLPQSEYMAKRLQWKLP